MIAPPITGDSELDSFLYNIYINGTDNSGSSGGVNPNTTTGEITDSSGNLLGYLYQFIHIKYADNNTGGGISNTPTGKAYYGTYNSTSLTESINPADYTWHQVAGTFGTTRQLYYYVLGGRQIKFDVNTAPQDYHWLVDSGVAINLDLIVPAQTITTNELLDAAVTNLKLAAGSVTAAKTNIAAISNTTGDLVANSVGPTQITDNAVTTQKITANAITAGKIAADAVAAVNIQAGSIVADKIATDAVTSDKITANAITGIKITAEAITADKIAANAITTNKINANAITSDKIAANAVTANKISVGSLSAISADLGSITAGTATFATDANNYIIIDGAKQQIRVISNGVVKVKIGNLSV